MFELHHYVRECTSYYRCKHCQKWHHALLHIETGSEPPPAEASPTGSVSLHSVVGVHYNVLLMTCCVLVEAPDGSTTEARALLDRQYPSYLSALLSDSAYPGRARTLAFLVLLALLATRAISLSPILRFPRFTRIPGSLTSPR